VDKEVAKRVFKDQAVQVVSGLLLIEMASYAYVAFAREGAVLTLSILLLVLTAAVTGNVIGGKICDYEED
jgi:hypothetical protein